VQKKKKKQANYSRERWRFSQFLSDSVLFSSVLCCALLCAKSALLCKGGWGLELVGNAKRQRESKQEQPLYNKQVDGWMDGGEVNLGFSQVEGGRVFSHGA
jgi:hypothetical protein